ncbi:hypothetical protein E2C01_004704 [Portunus trituberculatus]|uniref:Uncharacterized protein n=1 Tax=Portunus trituberculatus TaxID=210409 RepID=A0A5B7CQC8_PORTR|nr:hypothetical protein [Portunus trituberculatus]
MLTRGKVYIQNAIDENAQFIDSTPLHGNPNTTTTTTSTATSTTITTATSTAVFITHNAPASATITALSPIRANSTSA